MKCWGKVILVVLGFCLLLYSGIECSGGKYAQGGTEDWEAVGRILDASVMGVAGGLFGTGPQEREPLVDGPLTPWGLPAWSSGMPQGGSSPGAIFLGSRTWGALRFDITLTPAVINSDNDATCYTGLSIIIGKEIAKGGP